MKNLYTKPELRLSLFAAENVMTLSGGADSQFTSNTTVKNISVDMGDRVQALNWNDFTIDMGS